MIAYGPASPKQISLATHRPHRRHIWLSAGSLFVFGIFLLNVIAQLSQSSTGCRRNCASPPPPTSPAVSFSKLFRSSDLGFSLAYDPNYAGDPTSTNGSRIAWQFPLKSGGYLDARVSGTRPGGQSSAEAVSAEQSAHFSQFQPIFSIPQAEVGFVQGSGEVFQGEWSQLMGSSDTERLAILAAQRSGVSVTVVCEAPKVADNGQHANPAQLGIGADQFCDQLMNTVTWRGEKPL